MRVIEWDRGRLDDLVTLADDTLAPENLSPDELAAGCWDDPGVVLGTAKGEGVLAGVVRAWDSYRIGFVSLVAVQPAARRLGLATALFDEFETWAFDQGAAEVRIGGGVPFYFWPGIDVRLTAMLCLAEAAGYEPDGLAVNLSCPTTFRAAPPEGIEVRRLVADEDVATALSFAEADHPEWVAELQRGIEQGGAFAAFADDEVAGFGCHSVCRAGWIGPMATSSRRRHGGVGSAVLGELCRDLMVAGFTDAEISWVGPVRFYVKAAGASVSRTFAAYGKKRR